MNEAPRAGDGEPADQRSARAPERGADAGRDRPAAGPTDRSTDPRRALGRLAEDRAAAHLTGQGWQILARNWRRRGGELDLIARDGATLVFVEVRSRAAGSRGGSPEESVGWDKRRRLRLLAEQYLQEHPWRGPCRIDVVAIVIAAGGQVQRLDHYRDAA